MLKNITINAHNITDIPDWENFKTIKAISKGWTDERKYKIETLDGHKLLLRISDASKYADKKRLYDMLVRLSGLNIPMPNPITFGLCDNGNYVFQLLTWVEGNDIDSVLPTMTKEEQHILGLKSGCLLRKMHSVVAPSNTEDWDDIVNRYINGEIETYCSKNELNCEPGDMVIRFLRENKGMLGKRRSTFIHGDYNPGNLIITPSEEVGVIDFASSYGDPYWDIFKVSWRPNLYPYFFSGQIQGYFNNEPTLEFWNAYLYYFTYGTLIALGSPKWAGFVSAEDGMTVARNILAWSDNLMNPIPSWYVTV